VADAWIAATAMLYGVPLITHNPADYTAVVGLQIITEAPS
jgi:predicted nucleic acid-binding protein